MLAKQIKTLPNLPGVYQYFDKNGKLLYVGKAKILKNRVRSYFSFTPSFGINKNVSSRIAKMLSEAVNLEYVVTASESDALILENSFIKQLHPKYNILLRDDKTYPYIYIDLNQDFPRFTITRKVVKGVNIKYFGPYFRGAKEILEILYMQFKLVQKASCIKGKKSCLFYQIDRCYAPCENKISKEEYAKIVDNAITALKNPKSMISALHEKMMQLAENQNYEEAANLRDKIGLLKDLDIKVEVDLAKLEDFEVIAINSANKLISSVRFSIRDGKISNSNFNITNSKLADESDLNEIYKQVVLDAFPVGSPISVNKIYVYEDFEDRELVSQILTSRHNKKFEVLYPKIGEKRKICDIAYKNGEINIKKHLKTDGYQLLNEIKEYFKLSNLPLNIEAYDNSHMFGSAPVGAMIAYNEDGFNKSNYRHMHLSSNSDYDQMSEFLTMRAQRFEKLNPPDLWVIDGGIALLNLANDIVKSTGANIDLIAISKEKVDAKAYRAKGNAKDKIYTLNGTFTLPPSDKKLQFIQKLRDEAHRFAISFHQKIKRNLDINRSNLKNLGLSDGKIQKLIDYFGTFENVYKANFDEISEIIGKISAEKLKF
ncbi:UvrABC nucleotide excision repair complex, subunit UvrC [Campylobacter blaseri]|uniref:UvrABC system protein C n=1 Tax=Campylobacter blaseri TaxID=2042961 RepID=A0A2P8R0E4_9BACT|nr:excinuclease ABC subunit UvrC [Campylobacter blaseri]PSM51966.1 excinuclease ABC subunit C [Campylobacter blaseri]PSM53751.1 excinuclease ABC subunit C [Campylobacter blaseri]QKF85695.1 UvrABC nucleotide excision repair complex, subunit UvrC [Campylobacter blaseri]